MKKELFVSTIIHVSLLSLLFINLNNHGKQDSDLNEPKVPESSSKQTEEEKIAEKNKETKLEVSIVEEQDLGLNEQEKKTEETECPNDRWYGGVGMVHNSQTGEVLDAPKGYPAYVAGVKVGDYILNPHELRGEPGYDAHLLLKRDGEEIIIVVTREKICLEKIGE